MKREKAIAMGIVFILAVLMPMIFIGTASAALPIDSVMGTVEQKTDTKLEIHTEWKSGDFGGQGWNHFESTLELPFEFFDSEIVEVVWDEISEGDYVEVSGFHCMGEEQVCLANCLCIAKVKSSGDGLADKIITDLYGDPALLSGRWGDEPFKYDPPLLGNFDIEYDNKPDCLDCPPGCICEAEYTNIKISKEGNLIDTFSLYPGQNRVYEGGKHRIDVIFFSGATQCCLGGQVPSNFVIHIEELYFIITEHFVISYSTQWPLSVDLTDQNPANGIPDYVDKTGEFMEEAYTRYVQTWDFSEGLTGSDMWHVPNECKQYVRDGRYYVQIGTVLPNINGMTLGSSGSPYTIVRLKHDLNNDDTLEQTCFHEYFHAIQNTYRPFILFSWVRDPFAAGWIIEGTAEAMDTIAPEYPQDVIDRTKAYEYVRKYLRSPYQGIGYDYDKDVIKLKEGYYAEPYWYFIAKNTQIDFGGILAIKKVWIELKDHGWGYVKNAVDDALADAPDEYDTFDESFMAFAKANYFYESFYPKDLADHIRFHRLPYIKTVDLNHKKEVRYHTYPDWLSWSPLPNIERLENYGAHYFKIEAPQNKDVKVTFDGYSSSFLVMEYLKGEESRENILTSCLYFDKILRNGDADGTVYIIGRLGDSGSGDFEIIFEDVTSPTTTTTTSTILPTQRIPITTTIDHTTEATFKLSWQGSTLSLTLLTPEGVLIDHTSTGPDITHVKNATYEYYSIQNPAPGDWTMNIIAVDVLPEGENFTAVVYVATNLSLSLDTDKYRYDPGESICIHASLTNNSTPVTGASVQAEVQRPDGSENITLFDDGTHGDAQANDGVYSNTYTDTSVEGTYNIKATARGTIDGCPFVRERQTSVLVKLAPDLIVADIIFSDNTPSSGDEIIINASIQNIGGVNASHFTLEFYDGYPYLNGTYIRSDVITTNLTIGEAVNVATSWTAKSGSHNIFVRVLPLVLEMNESNNIVNRTIYVAPIYNLSIIAAGTDKLICAPNENVTIYCIIEDADHDLFSPDIVYAEIKNSTFNLSEYSTGNYMGIFNQTSQTGTYNITIYANKTGYENDTSELSFEVVSENEPPIASFTYFPESPVVKQTITFDASASKDTDGYIPNYKWDFGDGNITSTTDEVIKPSYSSAGDYIVKLTVTDNDGVVDIQKLRM